MESIVCTLLDDFAAFRLEKKPLDDSRPCLEEFPGEGGNAGREVISGEDGWIRGDWGSEPLKGTLLLGL